MTINFDDQLNLTKFEENKKFIFVVEISSDHLRRENFFNLNFSQIVFIVEIFFRRKILFCSFAFFVKSHNLKYFESFYQSSLLKEKKDFVHCEIRIRDFSFL